MKGIKYCRRRDERNRWVRFIPNNGSTVRLSSTDIRRIIVEGPPDELFNSLKDKVLRPEMLIGFVQGKGSAKKRSYMEAMDG